MASKAQISSEFFIFVGLGLLIAFAFEIASIQQLNDFRLQKENEAVKDVALKLQKELLLAANVEDGYTRVFDVPNKIDNIDYSILMGNTTITINSSKSIYIIAIPSTIGNLTKGTNTINKIGGVIYVNNKQIVTFTSYTICQNAENLGLCDGLDLLYGAGYKCSCCIEHFFCCTGC